MRQSQCARMYWFEGGAGGSVGRLAGWLVGWLVGWSVGWRDEVLYAVGRYFLMALCSNQRAYTRLLGSVGVDRQ